MLLGLEAEYVAGQEAELDRLLVAWPFEFVVLGVHVVDGFEFDEPGLRGRRPLGRPRRSLRRPTTAPCGGPPSTGGSTSSPTSTTSACGGTGPGRQRCASSTRRSTRWPRRARALELNTDRVSDPAGVMYPSPAILRAAHARGIPLVIDSDAHEAEHVGRLWDEAIALAGEAGYRETLRLSDHALVPLPGLG